MRRRWADFCRIFAQYYYEEFPLFQFYGVSELLSELFSESSLPMSRILAQSTILYNRQRWGDFCHISARYNYEGFPLFQLYGFTELSPKLLPESSLPMSQILAKTTISHKLQRWVDFCQIPACYNYEGFPLFQFYGVPELSPKLFSESSLPMGQILAKTTISHKLQLWVDFCQISARYNYEGFSLFQFYGTLVNLFFLNRHFG